MLQNQNETQLKMDLYNYGLKGSDWDLIPIKDGFYFLQNKIDRGFLMAGVTRTPESWEALEILESLPLVG